MTLLSLDLTQGYSVTVIALVMNFSKCEPIHRFFFTMGHYIFDINISHKNSSLPPLQSKFFVEHGGRGDSSSLPEPFIKLTCSHSRGTINPLTSYPPPAKT